MKFIERRCRPCGENPMRRKLQSILGAKIDAISWDEALKRVIAWAEKRDSRYVCICNAHSVVTTTTDPEFKLVINGADMSTPDGAPIAWALRYFGFKDQERINGPDLMWQYLRQAEQLGQGVYFYGSTDDTLKKLRRVLVTHFPNLRICGSYSPPFYAPTSREDESEVDAINSSGANVVFVGLGCPKQEKWMAAHCGRVHALMIGVGAAFDYHAGTVKRAPLWFQKNGLEWFHRLCSEPRRLFKRYMVTNTLFIVGISKQILLDQLSKNDFLSRVTGFRKN
jgi:N-acetylglucosaminyldiphosphoundecaprenol N-acetyl-beta-D-mannosaminyltransferase